MFISLEGPDGSGKTTQIDLLAERLRTLGHHVVSTREPGGTPPGAALRTLLLDTSWELSGVTEALLMSADRAEHVRQVIRPSLDSGSVVITDRYADSTLAYQGGGREIDLGQLRTIQQLATGGLLPDITFLLDLPVEVGLERRLSGQGINRLDREALEFHQNVAAMFRRLASEEPGRWRVIDATASVQMVHTAIWSQVSGRLTVSQAALAREEST